METTSSFKSLFEKTAYSHSYPQTFEDFLEICLCVFCMNPITKQSYYEDDYLRIMKNYSSSNGFENFSKLLGAMILFMEFNKGSADGNDLLGKFFEEEISKGRNGQYFTPFHICNLMTQLCYSESNQPLRVYDPACGSGRMLMSHSEFSKIRHTYYGIDIDPLCVKMSAINFFLNGMKGEVICANALAQDDFRFGYRISFLPLGIFRINEKEKSELWHINRLNKEEGTTESLQQTSNSNGQLFLF